MRSNVIHKREGPATAIGVAHTVEARSHRVRRSRLRGLSRQPHWLLSSALGLLVLIASVAAHAYGPGCPYCTNEQTYSFTGPDLHMAMKWCGISEAPSVLLPQILMCPNVNDFKTMMSHRHERASDCIFIPQARITLRSAGSVQVSDYQQFNDLITDVGVPGDVDNQTETTTLGRPDEVLASWLICDQLWSSQPKGVLTVSVRLLTDIAEITIARGLSVIGSIVFPWMMVQDTPWRTCG